MDLKLKERIKKGFERDRKGLGEWVKKEKKSGGETWVQEREVILKG